VVSDHHQKKRIMAQGRRSLAELEPKSPTSRCALPLPPVPMLLHVVAIILEVLAAVDISLMVEEVVDKFEPHPRLQMDVHISFPEADAVLLHNWFHSHTYLESPTQDLLVRPIKSHAKIVMSYNVLDRECMPPVFREIEM